MQLFGVTVGTVVTLIYSKLLYGKTTFGITHSFDADFTAMSLIICGSLLVYAIMNLSSFPVLFKIGYTRGRGIQILRFGVIVTVIALIMTHIITVIPHDATSFIMGMGCGLTFTGAGKRFVGQEFHFTTEVS